MHGGHLIEEIRLNQLQTGHKQLRANYHRHQAARQEHYQGKNQVKGSNVLVVGGKQPAIKEALWLVIVVIIVRVDCVAAVSV
jgi:hypothetical protein